MTISIIGKNKKNKWYQQMNQTEMGPETKGKTVEEMNKLGKHFCEQILNHESICIPFCLAILALDHVFGETSIRHETSGIYTRGISNQKEMKVFKFSEI